MTLREPYLRLVSSQLGKPRREYQYIGMPAPSVWSHPQSDPRADRSSLSDAARHVDR